MTVKQVVNLLKEDYIVAIPTDTVYGLFARSSANNQLRLNAIKNSSPYKKISLMSNDLNKYKSLINLSKFQEEFIESKIPGRYTFIVEIANKTLAKERLNQTDNVGIRIPAKDDLNSQFLHQILEKFDFLLATSLNITGQDPIDNYEEAKRVFQDKITIVDLKNSLNGSPSKIYKIIGDDIEVIRE